MVFYSIDAVMSSPDSILDAFRAGDFRYSMHFSLSICFFFRCSDKDTDTRAYPCQMNVSSIG